MGLGPGGALRGRPGVLAALGRSGDGAVGRPQRAGAVPQDLFELGLLERVLGPAGFRPGLHQRLRRGEHGLLEIRGRQVGAHRGLNAGVHPHRPDRAGRVDADQADPGQVGHGRVDQGLVGRLPGARSARDVAAPGRAGQHGTGDPVRIQHGGQGQSRPGHARGRQVVRALGGQRPGGQHRGGDAVDPHRGHVLAPLAEPAAVLPAAQPIHGHHGGGLGQPERQPAQVFAQPEHVAPLVGIVAPLVGIVGQPGAQVRQHLTAAEPADRGDPRPGRRTGGRARPAPEDGLRQPGGDDDLAGRARRPEVLQVGQADQVVQDQRPWAPGARQPADEAVRSGLGGQRRLRRADRHGGLREAGDDRVPAGRRDPDQRVDRAGAPQRMGERHRELRLARAPLGRGRRVGVLTMGQHHRVARIQARPEVKPGFRALMKRVSERRDDP